MLAILLFFALQEPHAPFVGAEPPRPALPEPPAPRAATPWFGYQVCGIGDVNGDSVPDVLAFARGLEDRAGTRALIFSGMDGADLGEVDLVANLPMGIAEDLSVGSLVRLSDLDDDGADDFGVVRGDGHGRADVWFTAYSSRGRAPLWSLQAALGSTGPTECARSVEDEDRDGIHDILLSGALLNSPGGKSTLATIVSGRNGRVLRTVPALRTERSYHERFCPIGDVDGDGRTDMALTLADTHPGTVRVCISTAAEFPALRAIGEFAFTVPYQNWSLTDVGDVDGDGVHDIGISETDRGVRVYSGCTGRILFEDLRERTAELSGFGSALAAFTNVAGETFLLIGASDVHMYAGQVECRSLASWCLAFARGADGTDDMWHHGSRIEVVGDVDSDGTPDYLSLGDHSANGLPGLFQLTSGRDGHAFWTARSTTQGICVVRDARDAGR